MPVAPSDVPALLALVRRSGVVPSARLAAAVAAVPPLPADPKAAAAALVGRGILTPFQAAQLLRGRHKGFRLGPHVILDVIGRGGMGVVYLAEHQDLRRRVAIKVMVLGKGDDAAAAAGRFLREARAVAALDHPNIVRIFDIARHNGVPYLVMEYVAGETLQQTLDRAGPLAPAVAAAAVAQAAAGLQHAHEMGFVHRDIKPANLIRDRAGVVKILDLGLAHRTTAAAHHADRHDHGAAGTADFIAPEQAMNAHPVDIRADVYSLGATFFALVAGTPPFVGNTTQKLLQHQITPPPDLARVAGLPPGLAAVAARMLAKNPADRFQTPAEVVAALSPWLDETARAAVTLSLTAVARSNSGLHASLPDFPLSGSSSRLSRVDYDPPPDSTEFDPSAAARETGSVAAARTVPSPRPGRTAPADAPRTGRWKRVALVAAGVVVTLAAGAAGGWLLSGR